MILIADAGSRKTSWAIACSGEKRIFTTRGINPQLLQTDEIKRILSDELIPLLEGTGFKTVFFYGAGCGREGNRKKMESILQLAFPSSEIYVSDDLTGAGRSLFSDKKGIACILGTGSNSGIYNGKCISERMPSLGYILGDEGSASYVGRIFIRDLFYNRCPGTFKKSFFDEYLMSEEEIMNRIYLNIRPNAFLADVAKFVIKNRNTTYFYDLLMNSINEFFRYRIVVIPDYQNQPLGFVGSMAWHNQDIIKDLSNKYNASLIDFIKMPIDNLVKYHVNLTGD